MYRGTRNSILQYCEPQNRGTFSVVFLLGFFIATIFFGYLSFDGIPQAEPTLRFISILHRHGERVPTFTYPHDPFRNESFWSEGSGELMQKGKVNLFELGKFLRNRYDRFIPARYKSTELYVLSTSVDRCIMSAQVLLAGLYPPVGNQIWNKDLLWQPIPVHSNPRSVDDILIASKPCPKLSKEKSFVVNTYIKKTLEDNQDLIDFLSNKTGFEIKTIVDLEFLYDNLLIAEEQGFKLPEWTEGIYPDKLKALAMVSLSTYFQTPVLKKLYSGILINEILSSMKKKTTTEEVFERLVNIYSAHDITIITLWGSMGIIQELPKPDYGATLIIELHQTGDKYRVKILYKNYALDKDLIVLNIKGCENDQDIYQDGMCDLDIFTSALASVTITNYDKECQIS